MKSYSLSHLSDQTLLRDLATALARDCANTAVVLAHLAEVDARRLYLPAAHPSMFSYCVHELHLSEDAAYKRIQAARAARQFPAIFAAVADGRLHLTAVGLLAPYLTRENADELLAAAAYRTKSAIETLLAQRFPRSETIELTQAFPASSAEASESLTPARGEVGGPERLGAAGGQLAPAQVPPRSKLAPVAPERFLLQLTIGRNTQEKLQYAQELLGHQLPSGDLAQVLDRALDALIERLERKFAATRRPYRSERPSSNPRHVPAEVKRAVWARDGAQCTFVSETGRRCPARTRLETVWNDGLAVVRSCRLREERPTSVARGHLDRGLTPAAPEPHTKGARRGHGGYHLRRDGCSQEGDQRGDAVARAAGAGGVAGGQRAGRDPAAGEEARA